MGIIIALFLLIIGVATGSIGWIWIVIATVWLGFGLGFTFRGFFRVVKKRGLSPYIHPGPYLECSCYLGPFAYFYWRTFT